jgi:uncharacterized glyoxalase superfamily protein PhnB
MEIGARVLVAWTGGNSMIADVTGTIPYVFCADAGQTADWCVRALGMVERQRWTDDSGTVTNVELVVGDSEIWLDGPVPDWKDRRGGMSGWVGLLVDDVDAVYRDLAAAGHDVDPPVTRFGTRHLTVPDPEGHEWGFVTRL